MKASDFINKTGVVVRLETTDLRTQPNKYEGFSSYTFPRKHIVIVNLQRYAGYSKSMHLTFFAEGKMQSVNIPDYFEMDEGTGPYAKAALDSYNRHVEDNLYAHLGHSFTSGADPEIFVEDQAGQIIPAFDFLGSKAKPSVDPQLYAGNKVYWDGYQAEFDVVPQTCLAGVLNSVMHGLQVTLDFARKHNPNAKLSAKTVFDIPSERLMKDAEEHVQFGCMPSFNAYGMKGMSLPGREVSFRSAGGHMHFGIGKTDTATGERIVKALDAIVGVACVSLLAKFDDPKRRMLYGLAGEYRLPAHGLEYRPLSNAWMFHPMIAHITFDLARKVVVLGQKNLLRLWNATEAETIECINTCDVEKAREILRRNKDMMLKLHQAVYHGRGYEPELYENVYNIFLNGMESAVVDPTDIEKNWGLSRLGISKMQGAKYGSWYSSQSTIASGQKVS